MVARIGFAFIVVLAAACGPVLALAPGDRCEADKHKAVARYLACRHKAIARIVKFGDSGAPDFSRCESKFSRKWRAAESKAGPACPTVGDEATVKAWLDQGTSATASVLQGPADADLLFAGYPWTVKQSEWPVGPGPNRFSGRPEDVWVDEHGLHLTITNRDAVWWSTEVILNGNLGYGTYVFHTTGRIDILDANMVLGMFTWDSTAPPNYREMDFEYTRWGNPSDFNNSQFVVQPYDSAGNLVRFRTDLTETDQRLTHVMVWSPGFVEFSTYHGHHLPGALLPSDRIFWWSNDGPDVPIPGLENVRINFWLRFGLPPQNLQPEEVVIGNFVFVP